MKPKTLFHLFVLLLAVATLPAFGQTVFFTDTFTSSTTNASSIRTGLPDASSTSYDIASTKATVPGTNGTTIVPNDFHLALAGPTSSGFLEAQAMFATNGSPVGLNLPNDYIEVAIVFTNSLGTIFDGSSAPLWVGLYYSGGARPLTTNLSQSGLTTTAGSPYATGNCAGWMGYVASINNNGTSRVYTRPSQSSGTASSDQDLVGNNFGSGAFVAVPGVVLATLSPNASVPLATSGAYTLDLRLTLTAPGVMSISNFIYSGAGTGGTLLFSQGSANISGANLLTTVFDGLAVGLASKAASPGFDPVMDISSITVSGTSSPITTPPTITSQPVPVVVAANGTAQFTISATGSDVTYQWYRNSAPISNGGDVSGATTTQLLISPAQAGDAFSGANGYYCIVTGSGGYSTNSVTNSLTLVAVTNLIWTGSSGATWDLATTPSWQTVDSIQQTFNEGDTVRFDDTSSSTFITVSGSFLTPSLMTVDSENGQTYSFSGSGNITGPGTLVYTGTGQLTLNLANSFSGGVLVSNTINPSAPYLYLQNYAGLGTGPVTLDSAGAVMEIVPTGAATTGINGDVRVLDDFNIKADGAGTYAAVFLGNLSGTSGKTLTIYPGTTGNTNRYRVYGSNIVYNANLVLDNVDSPVTEALYNGTVLAPYEGSGGVQSYNGIISGVGGIVQRGSGATYLNNNQNTYSGGTFPTAGSIAFGADSVPATGTVVSGPIGTGPLFLAPEVGSATGSGTVLAAGGARTIANPIEYPSGTNNLTLIVGGTNDLTFTGPVSLNGVDGVTSASFPSRIFQIGNTGATTFAGPISDSSSFYALNKTGTGTLYLNAASTFTGVITNSAGRLAGTGSVAGSVIVTTNAAIGGGSAASMGTFTIGGNLTFTNGNGYFRINRTGPSSDNVSVAGTIANFGAGIITVTNLGAALQVGDTFTLFNKPVTGGATLTVTGGDMAWSNMLDVNGTIQVSGPLTANYPTNVTFKISGHTLTVGWPATHLGWILQSQTNSLSTGLTVPTNTWSDVTGTGGGTNATMTINPANPAVFLRLRHP